MKPIHKVSGKDDLRVTQQFIQVRRGFVYATNSYAAIKIPIDELFNNIVEADEELYFEAKAWGAINMHKAVKLERNGLLFTAYDKKHKSLGIIEAVDASTFAVKIGRFPDINIVLPNEANQTAIENIGFNYNLLSDLCDAFGASETGFKFTFFGIHRAILVTHIDSKALGIIMPYALKD